VAVPSEERLIVNMRTAQLIGFSPHWDDLTDAVQLAADPTQDNAPSSLLQALDAAIGSNPTLRGSQLGADIAADQRESRAGALLPSLAANVSHTQIDASHANPLLWRSAPVRAGGVAQLPLYRDSAWAGWSVSRHLAAAANEQARQELLDTLQQTATAYFGLLRAKSGGKRTPAECGEQHVKISKPRAHVRPSACSTRSDTCGGWPKWRPRVRTCSQPKPMSGRPRWS